WTRIEGEVPVADGEFSHARLGGGAILFKQCGQVLESEHDAQDNAKSETRNSKSRPGIGLAERKEIPLTPALFSQREREKRHQQLRTSSTIEKLAGLVVALPLPLGEGRAEGDSPAGCGGFGNPLSGFEFRISLDRRLRLVQRDG